MPLYSTNKPKLFTDDVLEKLENMSSSKSNTTYIFNFFGYIYDFINQNKLSIIFFLMIFILLYTRYYVKKYINNIKPVDIQTTQQVQQKIQQNKQNKQNNNDSITSISSIKSVQKKEDKSPFTELNEEYDELLKNNSELMSENMINDIYKKKKKKLSIDEATRIIVDGCN